MVSNFLIDVLLDLTDSHSRQSIDLSDLVKRKRARLCRQNEAILSFLKGKPLTARLSLAGHIMLLYRFETSWILYDIESFHLFQPCVAFVAHVV